jgi:hypothetical protein
MLKYVFLASAMAISVPAFAQEVTPAASTAPVTETAAPVTDETAPQTTTTGKPGTDPAATVTPGNQEAPATAEAAPAPAPAQTGPTPAQIAQVVDSGFPTYDADKNGALSKPEFTSWMVALRTATEPSFSATAPETQTWITQAFTQADADKSTTVTNAELKTFLAPAAAGAGGQ